MDRAASRTTPDTIFFGLARPILHRPAQGVAEKIAPGIAAGAAASRSLTRLDPYRAHPPVFQDQEEKMLLEQHIEELRAELRSLTDEDELRQVRAELEAALEELDRRWQEDG